MSALRSRVLITPALLVVVLVASVSLWAGFLVLAGGPVAPLADLFGAPELLGWCVLAVLTGGIAFGPQDRRPPVFASGLVGSAALLGAGPAECALIGVAGALGSMWSARSLIVLRLLGAGVVAWATPGVLAVAAGLGGPSLGLDHPFPVASVVALWMVIAVGVPLSESLATHVALHPAAHVDPGHILARRLEPQTVLAALAILAAMSYAAIGPAAALIVLLPAAAARVGFAKHDDGRRAVSQTLAAMTVLPEWVGIVEAGHTSRVREVTERVTIDLGLESRVRRDVVRAAELHELGHLDGGVVRGDRGRIARSGAAVLEQAAMRERVVRILDATDPDRPLFGPDTAVELGAAIVVAACELDRMGPIPSVAEAATRVKAALGKAHRSAAAYL